MKKYVKYNQRIAWGIIGYLWFTYVVYLILPYRPIDLGLNEEYTVIFLLFISLSILMGAKTIRIYKLNNFRKTNNLIFSEKNLTLCLMLVILVILGYLSDLFARGLGGFTLALGENYMKMLDSQDNTNTEVSFWGQLYTLLSPLRYLLLSYCAYFFYNLSKRNRILYLLFILACLSHSLFGLGTQKGVGDILIILIFTLMIKSLRTGTVRQFVRGAFLLVVVFIAFMAYSQASRARQFNRTGIVSTAYYKYNDDNILCSILGHEIGEGIIRFGNYVSNGYPGLNYCLQMPFEWTYGYGGSRACDDYFHRYLGLESEFGNTYPIRMEKEIGWPGLMFWPSAFSWWASDIGWIGVVILMFLYTKFLCVLFRESYYYNNPLSVAVFSYLCIGIVYLPANNQLMQGAANFVSTIVLLLVWVKYHKKWNNVKCCNI